MGNVSMTIPTMFLAIAFISFKNKDSIEKPFVIFKSKKVATIWSIVVTITVGFANFFTIIQPALEEKDFVSMGFQLAGPIAFGLVALILINRYEKKQKEQGLIDENKIA